MIKIGSIYNTNYYGQIEVLSKASRTDYYTVRFIDTGTIKDFRSCQIKEGCVRDPYAKRVCGVACTGDISTKGKYKTYYAIWHDMINRCYNPNNKRYEAYKNVTVDDRWLTFENFYSDVSQIDGFDEKMVADGQLVLDKDIKQRHSKSKVYSKDTCVWVPKLINNKIQDAQQNLFFAISPDGDLFSDTNISQFAREHGLTRKHVSGVLHGRCKTTGGWRFSYKEIV